MKFPLTTQLAESTADSALKAELDQLLKFAADIAAKIVEIIGKIFIKTATVITGAAPEQGATIDSLISNFKKVAGERNITDIWIDDDITGWFPDEKVAETIAGPSRLLRFVESITHAKIIDGCKQLNAYQEYDLSDAITRATQLVAAGELDKKDNTGIIIYLTNRKNGTPCRLDVWRNDDGKLDLHVFEVIPDSEWGAGNGVLCSNENLDA